MTSGETAVFSQQFTSHLITMFVKFQRIKCNFISSKLLFVFADELVPIEVGMAGVAGRGGGKSQQTVLEQQ